ncbi:MAG: hypothetical protein COA96_01455 [SAR86 cluster bacterium]|uniref:Guanylate cyclase domain-containing protein n=1 Tax=SAR86 cluster bacterium TaxID=2030880 RepID=A0A2A5B9P2_9GAMM|nr:MAG: hypothetical protein COA96_01455 [SAR86 cluster bacterium]
MNSEVNQNVFEKLERSRAVKISMDKLSKGIDNYHIDVKLSKKFTSDIKKLVALLIPQVAIPKPKHWDNSKLFEKVRENYLDMMTVLIHRIKTDLSADEICFFQFSAIKLVLQFTRHQLDSEIKSVSARLTEHRNKGSSEALATDQRLFWLKKNYDSILYNVNKQIFAQFLRVEDRQLGPIRDQFLGKEYEFIVDAMINPLLYVSDLSALPLLLNEYSMFSWNGEDAGFIELNGQVEKLLNQRLKQIDIAPLRGATSTENSHSNNEIHDELGGLFLTQDFLGSAIDTKTDIGETFDWFELQENIELLFNIQKNTSALTEARKEMGFGDWWRKRGEINKLKKTLAAFSKLLRTKKILPQLLASHYMRKSLNPLIMEHVDLKIVCQFLSGNIKIGKLQDSISGGNKLTNEQLKSLESLKTKIKEQISKADSVDSLKLLQDISRFRQQLKYFRFAHRAFNRVSLRTSEEELRLSKSAGTLYLLPTSSEIEEDDERICHHAIMKADVRGSTTVTDELQNKGLNPASYFSMRFFNPINKILETYGANKVFIEGDAIILSFLEYEHTPQQWFSVARACGYSRDMLKITSSNNRHSTQMGLPLLELGVGICYSNEAPRYLYDEDKPIMISGAIGLADRMSSCSWNLREVVKKGLFNVDVLRIADGETEKGEKGQHYVRYNVNGILIDDLAFTKLKNEISLKSVSMKLNGKQYLFHVGQYPDTNGRKKDLVIREGKVGIWRDSQILEDADSEESYFEVVVNRKVIPLVLDSLAETQAALA